MTSQKILVLGAGELGLAILQAFSAHPVKSEITVLLRPASSPPSASRQQLLTTLDDLDIKTIYADLTAPITDLARIFSQHTTVISATGFAAGPGTQLHLCRAILQSTVTRYIPWQFGVDYDIIGRGSSQPLFDEQLDVRDLLRQQDAIRWTIISTGLFTSFLFDPGFGVVDLSNGTVTALGSWENRLTVTSAIDIGRITAEIVLGGTVPEGVVHIAGDTMTFRGVLDAVREVGWEVKEEVASVEELQKGLEADSENVGIRYQLIWAKGLGVAWDLEGSWNGRRGMKTESLRDYVARNLPRPQR